MKTPRSWKAAVHVIGLILLFSHVSIRAQSPVKVIGLVVDPNSAPIPAALIRLYSFDRILQTTSASSGHFQFDALPPGAYELEVMAPGFKITTRRIDVTGMTKGKPLVLTITMNIGEIGSAHPEPVPAEKLYVSCGRAESVSYQPRKRGHDQGLSGFVIDGRSKARISAATVQLFDASNSQVAQQRTNDRGEFYFKQILPGRYRIVFQHPAYNDMKSSRDFWVARENRTYIELEAGPEGMFAVCR